MPYLVPGWLFKSIGARTMMLPSKMVESAWLQFIPFAIRPDASM
jgi:hypothetical protein